MAATPPKSYAPERGNKEGGGSRFNSPPRGNRIEPPHREGWRGAPPFVAGGRLAPTRAGTGACSRRSMGPDIPVPSEGSSVTPWGRNRRGVEAPPSGISKAKL